MKKNYPSKEISPEDLWSQIIQTPRPIKVIDFPRYNNEGEPETQFILTILTQEEFNNAQSSVEKYVTSKLNKKGLKLDKKDISIIKDTLFHSRYYAELLFRCCRNIDDVNKPFFPSLDAIDKLITEEESQYILTEFSNFQCLLNPIGLDSDEMDMWLERLTIGGKKSLRFFIIGAAENIKDVFDVPLSQITEGQILAWVAARKHYREENEGEKHGNS